MIYLYDIVAINGKSTMIEKFLTIDLRSSVLITGGFHYPYENVKFITSAGELSSDKFKKLFTKGSFAFSFVEDSLIFLSNPALVDIVSHLDNITPSSLFCVLEVLTSTLPVHYDIEDNKFYSVNMQESLIIRGSQSDFERKVLKYKLLIV